MKRGLLVLVLATGGALAAAQADAASRKRAPTIGDLKSRQVEVQVDAPVEAGTDRARQRYQEFLEMERGDDALRSEAMRRLGDLKLESGEVQRIEQDLADGSPLDTRDAIALYTRLLESFPAYERNDSVLYQLARAYEADQQIERALATLDDLVARYPSSRHVDEAQFRRGEMLFSAGRFAEAEQAYASVIAAGEGEFLEQGLYKHGWSRYKRGDLDGALESFGRVLDRRLLGSRGELRDLEGFTRPQRELVEDTLRVSAVAFSAEDEASGIQRFLGSHGDRPYAYLLYSTLGDHYVERERWTDAAGVYRAFAQRDPHHERAPLLQMQAIQAYERGGFASLVLDGKREFVERYRLGSSFWARRTPDSAPLVVRELKTNIKDLAAFHHAQAQASKKPADYQDAARWYREFLESFPTDDEAAATNYLLADTLFESNQFREAALEYERTAYAYPPGEKSATAGYAALVAYEKEEATLEGEARAAWNRRGLDSAVRFATTFPDHPESAPVLERSARELYDLGDGPAAIQVADLLLARQPPVDLGKQRTAWTVIANARYDLGQFEQAEGAYLQVQTLLAPADPQRAAIDERLAASVYRQAESRQQAGDLAGAVDAFLRVGQLAPAAKIRANADYDAAALLVQMKDWPRAIEVLEAFRRGHPQSPLQAEVTRNLAVAYVEAGRPAAAATEFERIAVAGGETPEVQREALLRAAELHEQSGDVARTAAAWEQYLKRFPQPFAVALEGRQKLADIAGKQGDARRRATLLGEIVRADATAGAERSDRSRLLAARATLELAAPARDQFNAIRLTAPLKRSLDQKRAAMQQALKAYAAANDYGIAEVATAATFETAELYRRLAADLMKSERPRNLGAEELEQYDLLLEEQAFPFEEQAIEVHLVNAERASRGVYDEWVRRSYAALAGLNPGRFARTEQAEPLATSIDPLPPAAELVPTVAGEAPAGAPPVAAVAAAPAPSPRALERFAGAMRLAGAGDGAGARAAFAALGADEPRFAAPLLNLGILAARESRWDEAATALEESLRREPENVAAHTMLGLVERERGRFEQSLAAYRRALQLAPEHALAHRNLGVLLDLYLQQPAEALTHYESSLRLAAGEDKQMAAWIAEVRQRIGAAQKSARVEP